MITRADSGTADRTTLDCPRANRPQKPTDPKSLTRETSHASDTLSLIKHKVRSLPQSSVLAQLSTKAEYGTGSVRQSRNAAQPPVTCDGGRRRAPLKTQERGQGLFGKSTSVVSGLGVKLGGGGGRRRRACYTFIFCTGRRRTLRLLRLPRALGTRVCCSREASCCPRLARRWHTDCDDGTSPRHRARLAHVS